MATVPSSTANTICGTYDNNTGYSTGFDSGTSNTTAYITYAATAAGATTDGTYIYASVITSSTYATNNIYWEPPQLTPEQVLEQARIEAENAAARVRANALLESLLDALQRKEAKEKSLFHIRGSRGRLYRIRTTHASGNVEEIDEQGKLVARLCAQPKGIPLGDQLLAQKLLIETDEDEFIKIANVMEGKPSLLLAA